MTKHTTPTPPAGEFAGWLRATRRARSLKVLGSDVPCGTCNACCRSAYFIHVRPDDTRALQRIPRRLLFPAPGLPAGHVLMGFNEQGQCPMLIEQRCSIYDDRPQTCRDYDCRVFAATGIDPGREGGRADIAARVAQWTFTYRDDAARAEHDAVQATGAFLRDHRDSFPDGALPGNPVQLAVLALEVYELFVQGGKAKALTSPADIARAVLAELDARRPPPPPPLSSLPTSRRPRPGARRRNG
ncbi:MAG TPA: YkgJ family cysteine cluster protein [Kofleriaceae bacterium]